MTTEQRYRVTRLCCRSGMCLDCRAVANGTKRKRVVHADNVTEAMAKRYLQGWRDFEPIMESLP